MGTPTRLLLALLIVCAVLNAPTSVPRPHDENIYFLMAREVGRGLVPYRDFFFAHPPVMLVLLTATFAAAGTTWQVGTLVATAVSLGLLIGCFALTRRLIGERPALLSCALLLGSQGFLMSAQTDGNALSLMFVMTALVAYQGERPGLAGLLCGFAALTKLFALVAIPPILLDLLTRSGDRSDARRFLITLVAVLIGVMGAFLAVSGVERVANPVVLYHLTKDPLSIQARMSVIVRFLSLNALAVVAALPALRTGFRLRNRTLFGLLVLATLLILVQRRIYIQYLIYPLLPLIVFAGATLDGAFSRSRGLAALTILVLTVNLIWSAAGNLSSKTDAPFGRALLHMAQTVASTSSPEDTVLGHAVAAPTLAFLANRRMSADVLDLNYARVTSGQMDVAELVERIKTDRPRFIVLVGNRQNNSEGTD
ncbi:MAG: glycosyltransferase family 39 protein, partial [Candidatus Undinarchaeales archaeon]|nr:glycosyltransferase family 39 protein [Candidatus Undinarchaeales archaeon]